MSPLKKAIKYGFVSPIDKSRGDIYLIQEWLREKHKIDIVIDCFMDGEDKIYEGLVYHDFEIDFAIDTIAGKDYIKVLDDCIEQCFDLLKR